MVPPSGVWLEELMMRGRSFSFGLSSGPLFLLGSALKMKKMKKMRKMKKKFQRRFGCRESRRSGGKEGS